VVRERRTRDASSMRGIMRSVQDGLGLTQIPDLRQQTSGGTACEALPAGPSPTAPRSSRPLRTPFRPRGGLDEAHGAGRRPDQALSCQMRLKPSRVGVGLANLAPPITVQHCASRSARKRRREGWRGPVGEWGTLVHDQLWSRFARPWRRRQTLRLPGHEGAWRSSHHADRALP